MAATIVDSLVVLLNLDATKFTAEQKKALDALKKTGAETTSSTKDFDAWGKQVDESIALVRNSALRLLAVFTAGYGLEQFARNTTDAVSAQGRLAYSIGATTKEIATIQSAIEIFGGDAQAAGATAKAFNQSLEEAAITGQSAIIPWLYAMGIHIADANGKVKSLTELYKELAEWASHHTPQEANFFFSKLGFDQGTIDALSHGLPFLIDLMNKAKKAGVPDDADAAKLQVLASAWTTFEKAAVSASRALLVDVAPTLAGLFRFFSASLSPDASDLDFHSVVSGVNGGYAPNAGEIERTPAAQAWYATHGGGSAGGLSLFDLIQRLEGSGPNAVSSAGAVGRNQIKPGTAAQYGFDPSRLSEPGYNDIVARAIEADLLSKYNGDVEAALVGYNAGEHGAHGADRFVASGHDFSVLLPETQRYLAHERAITGGSTTSTNVNINTVVVNDAKDARGTAAGVRDAIHDALVIPSNPGPQ